MRNSTILQGDIWNFDPEPTKGNELGKKVRPILILSHNAWNSNESGIVIGVPLTSKDKGIFSHVKLPMKETGLKIDSYALPEQIRSISTDRLIKKIGFAKSVILKEVYSWVTKIVRVEA